MEEEHIPVPVQFVRLHREKHKLPNFSALVGAYDENIKFESDNDNVADMLDVSTLLEAVFGKDSVWEMTKTKSYKELFDLWQAMRDNPDSVENFADETLVSMMLLLDALLCCSHDSIAVWEALIHTWQSRLQTSGWDDNSSLKDRRLLYCACLPISSMIVECLENMQLRSTNKNTALRKLEYLVSGTVSYITTTDTPLTMAISMANVQAAQVVIKARPNLVNLPTRNAMCLFPLLQALERMHSSTEWVPLVSDLLNNPDIDVNVTTSDGSTTALRIAARYGWVEVVCKLLNSHEVSHEAKRSASWIANQELRKLEANIWAWSKWPDLEITRERLWRVVKLLPTAANSDVQSTIVQDYYSDVKRVLEFYYFTCQQLKHIYQQQIINNNVYQFVSHWHKVADEASILSPDGGPLVILDRFEDELCKAIKENKTLLSVDSFKCDQNRFLDTLLTFTGRWHHSILKIAAVIIESQFEQSPNGEHRESVCC